ncbi:MAG: MFS transporter [Dehalococcoidia bacterium]
MAQVTAPPAASPPPGRPRRRVFYGWWIALAGAGLQLLQGAVLGQAFGAYAVALRQDFGWSSTSLSVASALREMESGLTGPVQGWIVDRFGARNVARVGVLTLAAGLVFFSQVQTLTTFYIAFVVMALGASLMGYLTLTTLVVQWFERRRSTALSIQSMGGAFGGVILPFTVVLAIETLGWRTTVLGSAVVVLIVGLPLCQLFVNTPAEKGLLPDGESPEAAAHEDRVAAIAAGPNFTLREALREPSFWWVSFGHGSALFVVAAINVHLQIHLTESLGYTLGEAARVMSLITAMFMIGNLGGGIIGDYASKRLMAIICMFMHMVGMVLISHATATSIVILGAVVHGLAWGARGPQMAAIRAEYFGRASFGKIMGVSNALIIIGTIAGPMIAGYMYDTTGSYQLGFDMLAAMSGAGSIFFVLARRPKPPVRPAPETPPVA